MVFETQIAPALIVSVSHSPSPRFRTLLSQLPHPALVVGKTVVQFVKETQVSAEAALLDNRSQRCRLC